MSGLKFAILYAFAGLLLTTSAQATWIFDRVSGNGLSFRNDQTGKTETLKTDVGSPSFLAVLTDPESNTPYVIFEGRACPNCEAANTSLYLQRLDGKGKVTSFVYPGRIDFGHADDTGALD